MSDHQHPPPTLGPPSDGLRPLTQSSTKGKPYARFVDIEDEIRRMLGLDPARWNPKELKSETLIYLIRTLAKRQANQDVLGRLVEQIGRRVWKIVQDFTNDFDQLVRDEIEDKISTRVVELIFATAPTRSSEFLEIAFRTKVKALVLNELRRPYGHRFVKITGEEDEASEHGQGVTLCDPAPGPEEEIIRHEVRELIRTSIRAVTDVRHREAIILRYEQGWPMTDNDPSIPTLRTRFPNFSKRQIQNWINTAISEMRRAIGEKP